MFSAKSIITLLPWLSHVICAWRSSFVPPASPVLLLLLLDPYSPKQLRSCLHRLFLSLLTDSRFKSRFAAALGAVAYRPTSTLFCAGIGTEADTLLGFTVQLFTTGSLVKALGNLDATKALLSREDRPANEAEGSCISALPIAHSVVRSIHSNILGATKEVSVVVRNSLNGSDGGQPAPNDRSRPGGSLGARSATPPTLVYQFGSEHPLSTRLPGSPDDKFIDSRCMKHKRLPHLLRDLKYIYETVPRRLPPRRRPGGPIPRILFQGIPPRLIIRCTPCRDGLRDVAAGEDGWRKAGLAAAVWRK